MSSGPHVQPIKNCIICLYRIGFGCRAISSMTGKAHSLAIKWINQSKVEVPILKRNSAPIKPRRTPDDILANRLIMAHYRREQRASSRPDKLWNQCKEAMWTDSDRIRERGRRHNDPRYRAMFYARKRVRNFMKGKNKFEGHGSIRAMVGCSPDQLVKHIQSQFKNGMAWNNHGSMWEIDHIYPLAKAKDLEHIKRLCHYTNLQPLLKEHNRTKRDRIPVGYTSPESGSPANGFGGLVTKLDDFQSLQSNELQSQ